MNSRKQSTELVLKGIKKIDQCMDKLMKDIDCAHTRYLVINRILSASISSNVHYYTVYEFKNNLDRKLDVLENIFKGCELEEEDDVKSK
jgi:hypothetical protein